MPTAATEAGGPRGSGGRRWLAPLVLAAAVALVYGNSLDGELQLDDYYRVANNPGIEGFWPPWRHFVDPSTSATLPHLVQYRPMLPLSLSVTNALADAVGAERVIVHHLGNVALHLATCVLLFLLFREWLRAFGPAGAPPGRLRGAALAASLLYAVHPVAGVAVNYVCARDLLMMMLFLVASLLAYTRMRLRRGDSVAGWVATLGLLGLSLASKTNSLVACVLVLLFELLLLRSPAADWRTWARVAAVAGASGLIWFVPKVLLGFSDAGQLLVERPSRLEYPLTQLELHLFHYLRNVVWPFRMRPEPFVEPAAGPFEPRVLAGLALVLGSLALAVWCRRRRPLVSFSIGCYWTLFALTSSVLPLRRLATDYRQAPSLAFLFLAVVLGTLELRRRALAAALLGAFALYAGAASFHLNGMWESGEQLWGQSVRYGGTARAHMNYGLAVVNRDPGLAEEHYLRALELAPGDVYTRINLGMLRIGLGRGEEGLDLVREAAESAPGWAIGQLWLGRAYGRLQRWPEALAAHRRAAEIEPGNIEYQYEAGQLLQRLGDPVASLPYLERAWAVQRDYRELGFLLGFALQSAGRWGEAEACYRFLLERQPGHVQARYNLGCGLLDAGDAAAARDAFHAVLEHDPARVDAHGQLARCYAALGDADRAARHQELYERGNP